MITVVVNPSAGGKASPDDVKAAFEAAGGQARIVTLNSGDDIIAQIREAARTSHVVVAAGGDGTVNAVASVVAGTDLSMGVIPLGTLNHFARDMKIPSAVNDAIAAILSGRSIPVDAAEVNGRLFVNNSSIGAYPNAVAIRDRLREEGRRKWTAMAIAVWRVIRNYRGVHAHLDVNGRQFSARTPFVFVGNNEYEIQGLKAGGRERLTAGKLFVYLAPGIKMRALPMLVLRSLWGAEPEGTFEIIPTSGLKVDIKGASHVTVSLDGETSRLELPLRYQARPGALRVIA